MPTKANKAGRNKDKYYHLAKEQGYRARSAFKLIQLNKQFDLLAKAHTLVDLCAAPGGWLQVAAKYMPAGAVIVGVDLMPIRAIRNVITHTEDITTPVCRAALKRSLQGAPADIVLHDGAPNVGQNWLKDAFGQSELVLHALKLATEFLRPRGTFVTKVFRSSDYNSLLWVFHQLFERVEATKPHSSRNASAEIFVVCRDFKAPARIDPKLLDARYVFKELDAAGSGTGLAGGGGGGGVDVMHKKSRDHQRQREGYDATLGPLLTRRVSVLDFVRTADPVRLLTDTSAFEFDEAAKALGLDALAGTTEEVRACCDDLKILGRKDFKNLLKWRLMVRRALPDVARAPGRAAREGASAHDSARAEGAMDEDESGEGEGGGEDAPFVDGDGDDGGAALTRELSAAAASELARRKRELKRAARVRQLALRRQRLGMNLRSVDILDTDDSLFSLAKLRRYAGGNASAIDDLVDDGEGVDDEDDEGGDGGAAGRAGAGRGGVEGELDVDEGGGAGDEDDEEDDEDDDEESEVDGDGEDGEGTGGDLLGRLRSKEKREQLDELEDELDTAYARYVAGQERQAAQQRNLAETGRSSHGIKLSRRAKLEQQALLTEAALNDKLDAEHTRYLSLLASARVEGAGEVLALPEPSRAEARAGAKRRRAEAARGSVGEDDEDDGDGDGEDDECDNESADNADLPGGFEGSGKGGGGCRAGGRGAGASAQSLRWFTQGLFADAQADEEMAPASLRLGVSSELRREDADEDDDNTDAPLVVPGQRKAAKRAAAFAVGSKGVRAAEGRGRGEGDGEGEGEAAADDDGDVFPDWLKDLPRGDRDKWKAKLKKRRDKLERRAHKEVRKEAASGIQIVPASAAVAADVDDEFRDVVAAEARRLAGGSSAAARPHAGSERVLGSSAFDADEDDARRQRAGMDDGEDAPLERSKASQRLIRAGMGRALRRESPADSAAAASLASGPGFETVAATASEWRYGEGGVAADGSAKRVIGGAGRKAEAATEGDDDDDDDDDDHDDDDDDDEVSSADPREEDYDSDTHAEMLALGKKLKRHTTAKKLVDASYNRYAFSDAALPAWFATDESRHFRPQLPVTRAEVDAIKAHFRDIAARPIHKVAEARARKKRRLVSQLDKAKRQAAHILADDNEEMGARSKMKALAKAYKSAEVKRPGAVYVVAGKGGSKGKGKRVKFVDRLMKKKGRKDKKAVARGQKKPGGGRPSSKGRGSRGGESGGSGKGRKS